MEWLEERRMLATVTWINPLSGAWEVGGNWSNGTGPGASDDAVIDVPNVSVTHSTGNHTVASLATNDAFQLSGGTLTVNGNLAAQSGNSFILAGGTLSNATVLAGTTITATSGTLDRVTLAGTLDLTAFGAQVNMTGGLTLSKATVNLGPSSQVSFNGTQTLSGTGTVLFTTASNWEISIRTYSSGPKLMRCERN